jgi:hypothetical protein
MHFMLSLNWLCILNSNPECEFDFKIKIQMEGKVKIKKERGETAVAWTESPSPRPICTPNAGSRGPFACHCALGTHAPASAP